MRLGLAQGGLCFWEKGCMTEMSEPTIRLATPDDAPALLAIYEPYVRQTRLPAIRGAER